MNHGASYICYIRLFVEQKKRFPEKTPKSAVTY